MFYLKALKLNHINNEEENNCFKKEQSSVYVINLDLLPSLSYIVNKNNKKMSKLLN